VAVDQAEHGLIQIQDNWAHTQLVILVDQAVVVQILAMELILVHAVMAE
jgi:hypothetical protein